MKAVIQRCTSASVTVDGKVISSIGRGILCLIGIGTKDTEYEAQWLASKLLNMRLFPADKDGEAWGWKASVVEAGYEVLCVSQFTLMANLRKGSKPDFHGAMSSDTSKKMYLDFLDDLRTKYRADKVLDGEFGAMMDVQLVNDGPVTLILDSTTDAPPPATAKVALSNDLKAKRKQELAVKAKEKEERIAREKAERARNGHERSREGESTREGSERSDETTQEEIARKEDELIAEAERKSAELAERFKVAMTESY
ncbi:hypothetical protein JCM10212_001645 [Sporobolomyces blumeae]